MFKKKQSLLWLAALIASLMLAACQPQVETVQVEVTRIIENTVVETIEVEGEPIEVTRVVVETIVETVTVEVESETEEATSGTGEFAAADPTLYRDAIFGDINTLDPNLIYDTASGAVAQNVLETLIYYNHTDPNSFVPLLAEEVPSLENGLISEDGRTYTFNIREGVTFHDGGTLEPHDVAYTFQRGLLQSDPNGPSWLLLEPILGYVECYDITEEIDPSCGLTGSREDLIATATPEQLVTTCEKVKSAIVADDEAGTVTFNLAQPWGPFLATLPSPFGGAIIDQEWALEQGAWDGSCDTWQNYYSPGVENSELTAVINGTGPYKLESWTPGEGHVLVANENYWRTEPIWEGGPSGIPAVKTVVVSLIPEWSTRFTALQVGDVASAAVNPQDRVQVDQYVGEFCDYETGECTANADNPNGPLRKWGSLPTVSRTDIFMSFDTGPDSAYIGSGQLDGNGIPPTFFSDINVRRAMNYCFDYDVYIAEALNGEGLRNNGPIISDMLGYNEDGPMYEYDPEQCAAELEQAWDGALPETGFRFQVAYNTGNSARQTVAEILQAEFSAINSNYRIESVGLPWPTFLSSFQSGQIPAVASGWLEDIHDPHNWVHPFTIGTYAGRQRLPEDLVAQFAELVNAGVSATDPAERAAIYAELQQLHHDQAIQVTLAQALGARYEQRWVNGWYYNPIESGTYYYSLTLD